MGFDPSMIICKEIWSLVRYYKWKRIWTIPKDIVVVLVVQGFYASLRDQESKSIESHMWETVPVQGKEVREQEAHESEEEGNDDEEGDDEMDFEHDD
ncbi:hypothetical protein PVK06_005578 [Gossypium arboreum]|uniref:Uncharacterized protein n=1 Tax=Gossypium arboreum TaxID=29729 RepID=A0ABR0QUX9_GOSAR|nr:hypothetical protein PVK06_005578 [Gossypium arboreum]